MFNRTALCVKRRVLARAPLRHRHVPRGGRERGFFCHRAQQRAVCEVECLLRTDFTAGSGRGAPVPLRPLHNVFERCGTCLRMLQKTGRGKIWSYAVICICRADFCSCVHRSCALFLQVLVCLRCSITGNLKIHVAKLEPCHPQCWGSFLWKCPRLVL